MPSSNVKLTAQIDATSQGLIDALKKASGAVNDASSNWKDRFASLKDATGLVGQSVKNLSSLVAQVGDIDMDVNGIEHVQGAIADVSSTFSSVKGEIDELVSKLVEMRNAASSVQMPLDEYQRFADAAKNAGVSIDEARQMVTSMQDNIKNLANGVPEAEKMFSNLGLTIEHISGNSVADNFDEIVDAIKDTIPASEQATASMQLFKAAIDKTVEVSEQYNKLATNQSGGYASDKDLQNAISMQNVLNKLGEQLAGYANGAKKAGDETRDFNQRISDITSGAKMVDELLQSSINTLDRYNSYLLNTKNNLMDVSGAYKTLEGASDAYTKGFTKYADVFDSDEFEKKLSEIEDIFDGFSERLQREAELVRDIMSQRLSAGAPVDLKEVEGAIERINTFTTRLKELYRSISESKPDDVTLTMDYEGTISQLETVRDKLSELRAQGEQLNINLNAGEAVDEALKLYDRLEDIKRATSRREKIDIDTDDFMYKLYAAKTGLEELAQTKAFSPEQIDEAKAKIDELSNAVMNYQKEVSRGVPIWQPIVNAVNRVKTGIEQMGRSMRGVNGMWNQMGQAIQNCWNHMTRFKGQTDATVNSSASIGKLFGQAGKQILGMGTAISIITKAIDNLLKLVKEAINTRFEREKENYYGNAGESADDIARVNKNKDTNDKELTAKLMEFAELYAEEQKNGDEYTKARRQNLQDELAQLHNFRFDENEDGSIDDVDSQIAQKLDQLRRSRIQALESEIQANRRVINGARDYVDNFGYWHQLGSTFTGDVNGKRRIEEASERSNKAWVANLENMDELRRVRRDDPGATFLRRRRGKEADDARKKEAEYEQALDEAVKKLDEWSLSLDDDRNKQIDEITQKYLELLNAGVSDAAAREVAEKAIAKMLKDEKDKEDRRNKELLDALKQRIDAYKNAYQNYLNSEREVYEARKAYAKTQQDLANDARAERIERKRDRIQKQLAKFGFSLSDDFRLNESGSRRRRRRRNRRLDEQIEEKLQRWQEGRKVRWTGDERRRIRSYQALQRKDRQLEAAQKQMSAADKQAQAAEAMKDAAKAIQTAAFGAIDARKALAESKTKMDEAKAKTGTESQNLTPQQILDRSVTSGLKAPGVGAPLTRNATNYNGQLQTLHRDLQEMQRRYYLVR